MTRARILDSDGQITDQIVAIEDANSWLKKNGISLAALILMASGILYGKLAVVDRLVVTQQTMETRMTREESDLASVSELLRLHHENTGIHFTQRDAEDFQAMKKLLNEISAEQSIQHRMIYDLDRKLRFR